MAEGAVGGAGVVAAAVAAAAEVEGPSALVLCPSQMAPCLSPVLGYRRSRRGTWTWPVSQNQESCVWNCGCVNPADL